MVFNVVTESLTAAQLRLFENRC